MTTRAVWLRAGVLLVAVLVADQLTKALVRSALARGEVDPLLPVLDLVHVRNEGVAFGIAAGGQALVVALITVALAALVAYFATHARVPLIWLPSGLLAGADAVALRAPRAVDGHAPVVDQALRAGARAERLGEERVEALAVVLRPDVDAHHAR